MLGRIGDDERTRARTFISEIRRLNTLMGIPATFDCVAMTDIPDLVRRALAEAHGTYPVPRYMSNADCYDVVGLVAGRGPVDIRG
jgi:alcohol dehydrogenase